MSLLRAIVLTLFPALITPMPYDYFGNIDKAGLRGLQVKTNGNICDKHLCNNLTQPHFRAIPERAKEISNVGYSAKYS